MRFNGIDPRDISPKCFVAQEVIQAIPPRELRLVNASNGAMLGGVDLKEREIRLTLNFAGASHENANDMAARIAALFCTNEPGEYEPTHMPGKAFSAILSEAGDLEWRWGFGTVEYVFVAPRPFLHSTAETVVTTTGTNIRIEPRGTVPARPIFKHTMAAAAAALTFSIDGTAFFKLRNPAGANIAQGAVLVIDFEKRKVTLNNQTMMTYVDYTASDWHPLIIGGTNIVCSDGGTTETRWHDEWM